MSDENVTELFSGKPLSQLQDKANKETEELDLNYRQALCDLLDYYKDLVEDGEITGLILGSVGDNEIFPPHICLKDISDPPLLSIAIDYLQDEMKHTSRYIYGLQEDEYDE